MKDTSYWSIDGAIERLNKLCEKDGSNNYVKANWLGITNIEAIETVLHYTEGKDKKIKELEKEILCYRDKIEKLERTKL